MQSVLYDAAGHRRPRVTMPGFHEGRAPRNKGRRYRADPPNVEEIIAVMRQAGSSPEGVRLRALIVILWRAGLRIGEALDLAETDLDVARGAVLVRHGKGGRRRADEVRWQLDHMSAAARAGLRLLPPVGENRSGPLGPGLLASGVLGRIIRDLQAGIAEADRSQSDKLGVQSAVDDGHAGVVGRRSVRGSGRSEAGRERPARCE
jgi:integrase